MYLSKLTLNPNNKQVLRDVGQPYQLHATLARGFKDEPRLLWRLDIPTLLGAPTVLVQSHTGPDWTTIEKRFGDYFRDTKEQRYSFLDKLREENQLRFFLKANPTVKRQKQRHALTAPEKQLEWLHGKGEAGGFELLSCQIVGEERQHITKHEDEAIITILSVTFTGILKITNVRRFLNSVESGIGPAKGFGLGLLSIAPIRTHNVH